MASPAPEQTAPAWSRRTSLRYAGGILGGMVLGAGLWLLLVLFQLGAPTESTRWNYRILQQKRALAATVSSPRTLLLGGSNVLFGLRARLMEQESGRHTVNFGSHAGLGRRYLMRDFQRALRRGDTAVLCLEYELYSRDEVSETLADFLLARDPDYLFRLDRWQLLRVLFGVTPGRVVEGCINRLRPPGRGTSGYDERTVDPHGDETLNNRPPNEMERIRVAGYTPNPFLVAGCPIDPEAAGDLEQFIAWCRANAVELFVTFPSTLDFPAYHTPAARDGAARLVDWFETRGARVVGAPESFLYPREAFFDTNYHLTGPAAERRTRQLLELMRASGPLARR